MRAIKTYKMFEDSLPDEDLKLIYDIEDILLSLKDFNALNKISRVRDYGDYIFCSIFNYDSTPVYWYQIEDEILRLTDFLKPYGFYPGEVYYKTVSLDGRIFNRQHRDEKLYDDFINYTKSLENTSFGREYKKFAYLSIVYKKIKDIKIGVSAKFESKLSPIVDNNADKISIYDWFEELKGYRWTQHKSPPNEGRIKFLAEHFIGKGCYDQISKHVDDILKPLNKVNIDDVYDRLYDLWDELPANKHKSAKKCVVYHAYYESKYNGAIFTDNRLTLIITILIDIVYPTIYIGYHIGYPSVKLRQNFNEIYVTDTIYTCKNFDIDYYEIKANKSYINDDTFRTTRKTTTTIYESDISRLNRYTVNKIISLYKPCISIDIDDDIELNNGSTFNLDKIESLLDECLLSILPELDYEEIIWDKSRNTHRNFDNKNFYDYSLKIILK